MVADKIDLFHAYSFCSFAFSKYYRLIATSLYIEIIFWQISIFIYTTTTSIKI